MKSENTEAGYTLDDVIGWADEAPFQVTYGARVEAEKVALDEDALKRSRAAHDYKRAYHEGFKRGGDAGFKDCLYSLKESFVGSSENDSAVELIDRLLDQIEKCQKGSSYE